jgi:hypothetical protein
MAEDTKADRLPHRLRLLTRRRVAVIAFAAVTLLVCVRAECELAMMWEYGSDAQMPIWWLMMLIVLALWFAGGSVLAASLVALWPRRWGLLISIPLAVAWVVAICVASWKYQIARQALADAADSSTSPDRLSQLVHFNGIQAGYELDNRIASNPNTPPEALRELSKRDQLGTKMCIMRNRKTPRDVLDVVRHELH